MSIGPTKYCVNYTVTGEMRLSCYNRKDAENRVIELFKSLNLEYFGIALSVEEEKEEDEERYLLRCGLYCNGKS